MAEAVVSEQNVLPMELVVDAVTPFLKWAGGKGQMVDQIVRYAPARFGRYIEPFLGGGALFFYMRSPGSLLNDLNDELINTYRVVQNNVEQLIAALEGLPYEENFYYEMRSRDPAQMPDVERAARFIYLNRTCFNGLYRVNKRNEFNVPFGRYTNPVICDPERLRAASTALREAQLFSEDYKIFLLREAQPNDFIYIDPPYQPMSKYSDFKRYTSAQFKEDDQRELASLTRQLVERGCQVLASNSDTPLIRELYDGFELIKINARRNINKNADGRGTVKELLIVCRQ
jgi:DNA adenine methylase